MYEIPSSLQFISWRKKSLIISPIQYFSKNQNAIDHPHSENDNNLTLNQQLSNSSREANIKSDVTVITRCISKPSRQESVQIATPHTRKRQRDRYVNYSHRLQENELYSLLISSNGIECHGRNCQPSVFNASHRCRTITSDHNIDAMDGVSLMNEQEIKQNISYVSLTNLSDLIEQEPHVSRRDSHSRSTSHTLMHKPSMFLADLLNKMTHEQRAKSIAQLAQFHENLTKSNLNQLQRSTSLPNLDSQMMKLYSVTSVLSDKKIANQSLVNMETSLNKEKTIAEDMNAVQIDREALSSTFIPDNITRLPVVKPSPILIKSSKSDATIDSGKTKTNRSNNSLQNDPDTQSLKSKSKSFQQFNIERMNTHSSNVSNQMDSTNSKSTVVEQYDWGNAINEPSTTNKEIGVSSSSSHSQPDITQTDTHLDKSIGLPSIAANQIQLLPTINGGDETSIITRGTTASTNLTILNDDVQSKLINEQLKRSSLDYARDSLELLRNTTPYHANEDEQINSPTNIVNTSYPRKSVLKSHSDSSDHLPTSNMISYVAIDEIQGDKHSLEQQIRRRSLTLGNGGTVVSCVSPRPRRDSLTLLQERYSGLATPHSGYSRLSGTENKHVEFIRDPGDTITPVLHLGRGMRLKHSSTRSFSSPNSTDPYHEQRPFSNHTIDSFERRKSDSSILDTQLALEAETSVLYPRKTLSLMHNNDIESERIYFNKNDYDKLIHLLITPLSKSRIKQNPLNIRCHSNIELCITHRLTTFQNFILMILLLSFYVFILIKSHYWEEYYE